jgi:ribbon-helix-helix CopG family protein
MDQGIDADQLTEQSRGGRRSAPADVERLNVHVSASAMKALREVAEASGMTLTEAVRRAIGLLKLVDDATRDGVEIQFVDPKTNKTRVLQLI